MATVPDYFSGSFYRTTVDVTVGTLVPSVVETFFDMIQTSMDKNYFFQFLGLTKESNLTLTRILRIILEPPILIGSVLLVESGFVNDVASVGLFLPVVVNYNVERYFIQLGILKQQFIDWVESMESPKPAIDQV